ncbi:hypothetical protein V1478_005062 [Vespula squamosa]|uniref:Uncharacterized protein n=1 Tax=Vespula squamosa TaxID=30214 RepID=A0ABD2BD89_VESSQ
MNSCIDPECLATGELNSACSAQCQQGIECSFSTRVGQVIPNRDSDVTSATKFQKRKDDLREHDMLLKELRNTQRFGIAFCFLFK